MKPGLTPGAKRKGEMEDTPKRSRRLRFDVLEAWGEGEKDPKATLMETPIVRELFCSCHNSLT